MRAIRKFSLLLITLLVATASASPQGSSGPPKLPPHVRSQPDAVDQERTLAYWTTETGWGSELQLRNNATAQNLTVTPVLRSPDGAETPLAPVTLKPQEVQSISLDAAIATARAPQLVGAYGSAVLRYRSPSQGSLYAAMIIRETGHPVAVHIDSMGESQDLQAGSREGVWWLPRTTTSDWLILSNSGKNTIPLDFSLYDASGRANTQKLILGPRETTRFSIRKFLGAARLTGSYGGIKLSADAHAGSLDAVHFLFDESAGYSATLKMFEYDPKAKLEERDFAKTGVWTLRAPMLALSNPDPALAFPPGTTLQPQLFIRNTTAKPVDAALTFNWRAGATVGKAAGPQLRLNPYETRRIDITALQDGDTLPKQANWTSVTLTTKGLPDELLAVAASYDKTLRYGAQTPFNDQLSFKWKGGMWEYDPYHNSIITAGNGGTKPALAAFTIFYNQGEQRYDLEQLLQPDEQMWIDVGKLIREQVPDKNGKTLPANLTSGSYEFRDLTNQTIGALFEGKVIYDKTYGHVAYGCAGCCGYSASVLLTFDPLGIPLGSTSPNGVEAWDVCAQAYGDVSDSFFGAWSTVSTTIATVNYYGTHTGVSLGSTTSNTSGFIPNPNIPTNCPLVRRTPSGGANVITISQSPITLNMSSGDTSKGITVSVSPATAASSVAFAYGSITNPNSSSIATFTYNKPSSFTGNDLWKISIGGTNSPSGMQNALGCAYGVCARQASTTNVPPQVLIQVLYGEAHGQAAAGDTVSEPAVGSSIKDRFGHSEFPGGSASTYQAVIVSSQYNGINTSITTGVEPELDVAVSLFNGTQGDTVAGSPCFFSPTASDWTAVQNAYLSGTTTVPPLTTDPGCYRTTTPGRQIVIKNSMPDNVNGNGAPAFLFERQKSSDSDPAVVAIS